MCGFVGDIIDSNSKNYYLKLKQIINKQNLNSKITFRNGINRFELNKVYNQADLIISTSETNSLDKVILEAMACETLVLTSNKSFSNVFKNRIVEDCYCNTNDVNKLKDAVINFYLMKSSKRENICKELRKIVVNNHSLEKTMNKISYHLHDICSNKSIKSFF